MIKLTQKEFDLLRQVHDHEPTDAKPFKVVSNNNGSVKALVEQGLVQSRPKEGNALMQELAIVALGTQVINNEVEHEIVMDHTDNSTTETVEETTMEQENLELGATVAGGFVIEQGVPMPDVVYTRKPRANLMPLDKMNVGDSFLVPFKDGEDHTKGRKRVGANVQVTKKRLFGKDCEQVFVVGIVENGYRVWRKV